MASNIAHRGAEPQTPAWMSGLRSTINSVVTPETLEKIIKAQVAKAEKGDAGAARFVLELYGACQVPAAAPAEERPPLRATPAAIPTTATPVLQDLTPRIRMVLKKLKHATPGQIAANLIADIDQVEECLLSSGEFQRAKGRDGAFELIQSAA